MSESRKTPVLEWQTAALCLMVACLWTAVHAEQPPDNGIPAGYTVVEGDIIVPVEYLNRYRPDGILPQGVFATNFWPNGVVPYQFDANVIAANQTAMIAAMGEWEAVAHIDFVARSGQSNYIHIQDSTENSSMVGRQGGRQVINIFNWNSRFIMVHELGHALGMWHEHTRPDRDDFVIMNWANIEDAEEHNFQRHDEADVYGEYDFESLMHYGQCSFSTCANCGANPAACRTITVRSPWDTTWQNAIGQRTHLSVVDELTISMLYPEPDWVFVDRSYTGALELGSFLHPYKHFPDGATAVPVGGTVIIQPGSYASVGVYTKAMTLHAPLGGVVLRN